jgi:phytoene/squalene synthetase
MIKLYQDSCTACSKAITNIYSTSFSLGIRMISRQYRNAIYDIYGFVRIADEIVDTLERSDKAELLEEFRQETYTALKRGISMNPVINSFVRTALTYNIEADLIEPFFESMKADLDKKTYDINTYTEYIYGSAEVVGLMCLKVFCNGKSEQYNALKKPAQALGAAFQKVNFLRDIKSDTEDRGRVYFPGLDLSDFNESAKHAIIEDVKNDFRTAYAGIKQLPVSCRFGVYTSYKYYLRLLEKIERSNAREILNKRIRVANGEKVAVLAQSYFRIKFNVL